MMNNKPNIQDLREILKANNDIWGKAELALYYIREINKPLIDKIPIRRLKYVINRTKKGIKQIEAHIAEIQANCEHNSGKWIMYRHRHTHYRYEVSGHNCTYYKCYICEHEIKI